MLVKISAAKSLSLRLEIAKFERGNHQGSNWLVDYQAPDIIACKIPKKLVCFSIGEKSEAATIDVKVGQKRPMKCRQAQK